ncbi:hypothetical protein [Kribbella italica]|uniref:Uncharacterized protein n=1 Tax=Kribbella italica TaxID=1540520 RepID=A0A7W9JDG9_9ACTN|nr:hypothetical protein [Kribbella italica]MBB5839772.1 hypothetical protein [Kribbella italica]
MTKSDDEFGDLLRETFVSKENQVDRLPEAIKDPKTDHRATATAGSRDAAGGGSRNRRFTPVLAGAAAVVIVLGGAFVVRQNLPQPTTLPAPAVTTTQPSVRPGTAQALVLSEDIRIWAAALKGIIEREPGAPAYYVTDAAQENENGARGKPFTDLEKTGIASLLAPQKVEWIAKRPVLADPCAPDAGGPYVNVGKIVDRAGHVEIDAGIWRGCLAGRWLTFRLDQKAGDWKVTGTIGPEAIS